MLSDKQEQSFFFFFIVIYREMCIGNVIMLKLNDDKTEFNVFKSKHSTQTFVEQGVQFDGTEGEKSWGYI